MNERINDPSIDRGAGDDRFDVIRCIGSFPANYKGIKFNEMAKSSPKSLQMYVFWIFVNIFGHFQILNESLNEDQSIYCKRRS